MSRRVYDVEGGYRSDDLEADFTATATETNYPDEMQGRDITGVDLVNLTICGVKVNPVTEFVLFPDRLKDAIMDLAKEIEWRTAG
jgi:hypothetical protein